IHVYAVQARRRRSRAFDSLETRDPAYHSTAGILKREGLRDACAVGLQRIASSRLVSTHRSLRIGPHGAVEKIEGRLRPFEMPAHYKRRRDHEDQALRNPENDEDFEKQS